MAFGEYCYLEQTHKATWKRTQRRPTTYKITNGRNKSQHCWASLRPFPRSFMSLFQWTIFSKGDLKIYFWEIPEVKSRGWLKVFISDSNKKITCSTHFVLQEKKFFSCLARRRLAVFVYFFVRQVVAVAESKIRLEHAIFKTISKP